MEKELKSTSCRACGAEIVFLPTWNGKQIPIDVESIEAGDEEYEFGRHQTHFETCTKPEMFKKR